METTANFDILAGNSITPAADTYYNLGQWGRRWTQAFARSIHVEELLTDVSRSRADNPGISIGSYSGQNGAAREPAWIFRPDPLNNSKLAFVSLQDNKLIANRIV